MGENSRQAIKRHLEIIRMGRGETGLTSKINKFKVLMETQALKNLMRAWSRQIDG